MILQGANTLANSIVMYEVTPSAAPFTYTVAIKLVGHPCLSGWSVAGINFRESSTGRIHMFRTYTSNAGKTFMTSTKFTNATTYSADYLVRQVADGWLDWVHMRISDDNTNRVCSYSLDGYNFNTFHSIGRTDFLTANRVNFGIDLAGSSTSATCGAAFANWRVT